MFPHDKIGRLLDHIRYHRGFLTYNAHLDSIHDGDLLRFVKDSLRKQLGPEAFKAAEPRIPPINVLQQLIDKLSTIYEGGVQRALVSDTGAEASEADMEAFSYMQSAISPDVYMSEANRIFNLMKGCLLQPYLSVQGSQAKPALRVIDYSKFLPYSNSPSEPDRVDGFILILPKELRRKLDKLGRPNGREELKEVYYAIEADEFCWFTEDGDDITPEKNPEAPDGFHDLGRIPLVYINRSLTKLVPTSDSDTLAMTLLLPVLLTDVNFVSAFQCFGFIFTVNVKTKKLDFAPNAVWHFQQDESDERKPEVGTIKASNDIDAMLNSAANQYAMWLQTKGIKPGAVGDINASNFSSGISKILDEMDTSSNRKKQIPFFSKAEEDLWDLLFNTMLPLWRKEPGFTFNGQISASLKVSVEFPDQIPMQRFGQTVEETQKAQDAGYLTRKMALKRIHPTYTEDEIEQLMEEIDAEKEANKPDPVEPIAEPIEPQIPDILVPETPEQ